ncbi:MAG: NAD(P)H-dependent glycerol-3-phosphate dehydrogenase [Bauldia sp.]
MRSVGILGGGAWATALAVVAARAGRGVTLYARDPATVDAINRRHENTARLPGIALDPAIRATAEVAAAAAADVVLLAVPAQVVRAAATLVAPHLAARVPLVICAKGLERGTDRRLSEVVAEVAPLAVPAVLSGPSFAADVARGLPTAVTIAAADEALALALCHALGGPTFRPYAETDLIGVEIGGAVKNVLAIAAGIVSGRELGASALAALIARGFAELRRLAESLGARRETLMGLSGLGDLVLTCSGPQSRNFAYGVSVGANHRDRPHPLAEGIETAAVARDLARRNGILMPIVEAVAAILEGALGVDAAIESLMTRPFRREAD